MIVKKSKGGGLAINPNHIFADTTARDAYFALHPTELVKGTFISVGTDYEEYDGGAFQEKNAVIKGEPGNAGSIQVGTVTTLPAGSSATVVNVGTTNSAIFDFGIPKGADGAGGGSATWGGITGTLSAQTDLNSALNGKQATLVSGTNIKTINGTSILGSGNMVISGGAGAVDSVNTKTGTVTLNQDEIPDGTTYKQYSQTEKTKLAGIATGAQVNTSMVKASATDTTEGYLGDKLVAGTNVTITKNNSGANETYTIASTASGGGGGVTVYADLVALKAVDTTSYTTVQTVQVASLGLYKFQPTSTLTGDDVNVITPSVGSSAGRWVKQSVDTKSTYKFRPADYGAGDTFFEEDSYGGLIFGGTGGSTGGAEKGIVTCDELISSGIVMRFTMKDFENYPSIFIAANGTYIGEGANFRAFSIYCNNGGPSSIRKHVGSTITTVLSITNSSTEGSPTEFYVKKYGNRMSIWTKGKRSEIVSFIATIEDDDLSLFGNINGFSNGMSNVKSYMSDMEFKPLTSYGKNIVLGGDSQTASGGIKAGLGTWEFLLRKYYKKNIDVHKTAVSGRTLSGVISGYATEVTPKKSAYAENIYYINIGTNDISGSDAATMLTKFDNIVALAKADGFKVFATTIAIYGVGTVESGVTKTYNDGIRARKTSGAIDYLLDFYDDTNGFSVEGIIKRQYIVADGLHFSPEMRELIADRIIEILGIKNTPDILTGIGSGEGVDYTLSYGEYQKVRSIDQTFTAVQNTKLNAVNAVGTAVASATTISVPANKTIFHVTGTTAISTINLPYTGFTGQITIIPDGIFTLVTGGNIAEAYTAVVNRAIQLVFDGTSWYRVNS